MKATCPVCDHSTEVLDELIPPDGVQRQCARCGMAYMLHRPGARDLDNWAPTPGNGGFGAANPPPAKGSRETQAPRTPQAQISESAKSMHNVGRNLRRRRNIGGCLTVLVLLGLAFAVAVWQGIDMSGMGLGDLQDKISGLDADKLAQLGKEGQRQLDDTLYELEGDDQKGDLDEPGLLERTLRGGQAVKGEYVERVEMRDGKKVRIWVPRESPEEKEARREKEDRKERLAKRQQQQDNGDRAPSWELHAYGGGKVRLDDQLGKVVVLNFYATWCGPCRREIPGFARVADSGDESVVVLGLVADSGPLSKAGRLSRKMGINYDILHTPPSVKKAYKIKAFPTTIILNEDGVITETIQGAIKYNRLKAAIDRARTD